MSRSIHVAAAVCGNVTVSLVEWSGQDNERYIWEGTVPEAEAEAVLAALPPLLRFDRRSGVLVVTPASA